MYQQGTHKVEVIVRKEVGATQDGATAENQPSNAVDTTENENSPHGTSARARFLKVNVSHALGIAKEMFNAGVNYYQHQQGLVNGDQALADNIDRRMEIVQDVTGTASHIAMGALYGSAGGPLGAVFGAVMATASSAISLTSKYANRELEFNYKMFKLDNGVQYQRARAGINLTTGRLR